MKVWSATLNLLFCFGPFVETKADVMSFTLFNVKFSEYLKYKHEVKKTLIVYFKVKKILILCVHGEVVMLK